MSAKRGIAVIEFVLMIMIFITVTIVLYGSWGVIHAGILNSIAARTYATSIINNRSNLLFLHEWGRGENFENNYRGYGMRFFATVDGREEDEQFISQKITLDLGGNWGDSTSSGFLGISTDQTDQDEWLDNQSLGQVRPQQRNQEKATAVIRLKQGYGICMNSDCKAPQ